MSHENRTNASRLKFIRTTVVLTLTLLFGFATGCEPQTSPAPETLSALQFSSPSRITLTAHPVVSDDARDPHPITGAMVHLDVYVIDLPMGSVSNSTAFWKHIDEESIGVAASLEANRNGLRCGTVPLSESAYYSKFLDQIPHYATKVTVDEMHAGSVKLDLDKTFESEDLFLFNSQHQLEGRSYESGINQMSLAYGPAPRNPGAARLVFCPVIDSSARHLQFTTINNEIGSIRNGVDRLHDQAIIADVPDDSFFVLCPLGEADRSSIGGAFFVKTDSTVLQEQVIIAIPTFVRLDGKPITLPDLIVKTSATTTRSQIPVR